MKFNDVVLMVVVLLMGVLIGAIGTAAVFNRNAEQGEESETKEALKQAQEERDSLQSRINSYQEEAERKQQQAFEQPNGDAPAGSPLVSQRPVVAAAPRTDTAKTKDTGKDKGREAVPAPQEDGSGNTATPPPKFHFGPPITPRPLDNHATDNRQKTTP